MPIARTLRTQAEWKAYFALPETDFYVLADGSSIVAYGVVGKGTDLQHCVHEWGGDETALPALIGGIFGLRSESELFVMAAPWKDTAVNAMSYHEIPAHLGVLGMVQLLDPPAFCQRLGVEPALERAGGDHAKLVRLLFGWSDTAPLVPLYLYGLDSM